MHEQHLDQFRLKSYNRSYLFYFFSRILFWTEHGSSPKIRRSSLDGSSVFNIVISNVQEPMGITIDYVQDMVYWVDRSKATIEKATFIGQSRETVTSITGSQLFGISVLNVITF